MIAPVLMALLAAAAAIPTLYEGGDAAGLKRVPPPGVRYRMNMAMATSAPWIDSNLWRYWRKPDEKYITATTGKSVTLAMAEGYVGRVSLALEIDPSQKQDYDKMAAWLAQLPAGSTTPWINFTVSDDGSALAGEVLNLMARRNLLFGITTPAKANYKLTSSIKNPYEYALNTREQFGDDKRILRIFGSELTMAHVAKDGKRVRLQLVNYGSRPVEDMRLRLKGRFPADKVKVHVYGNPSAAVKEFVYEDGFTEFTLGGMPVYGVLDLEMQ